MSTTSAMLDKTKAKIHEWRGKGTQSASKVRDRLKSYKGGGSSVDGLMEAMRLRRRRSSSGSEESLMGAIREKGLMETIRSRRAKTGSTGSKEYGKNVAIEGSTSGQLKIQRPTISIEA